MFSLFVILPQQLLKLKIKGLRAGYPRCCHTAPLFTRYPTTLNYSQKGMTIDGATCFWGQFAFARSLKRSGVWLYPNWDMFLSMVQRLKTPGFASFSTQF